MLVRRGSSRWFAIEGRRAFGNSRAGEFVDSCRIRATPPKPEVHRNRYATAGGCNPVARLRPSAKPSPATASTTRAGTQLPCPPTVLAAQVAAGEFKDPYYSDNLRKIPGTTYPVGENFSNLPMAADSPYHCSWWYRKQFVIPAGRQGPHPLAALWRNQLPRQCMDQRQADRRLHTGRRRVSHL